MDSYTNHICKHRPQCLRSEMEQRSVIKDVYENCYIFTVDDNFSPIQPKKNVWHDTVNTLNAKIIISLFIPVTKTKNPIMQIIVVLLK